MKKIVWVMIFCSTLILSSELSEMENACKRSISEACYELAMTFSGQDGLKSDEDKAKKYYRKACDLGLDRACKYLDTPLND